MWHTFDATCLIVVCCCMLTRSRKRKLDSQHAHVNAEIRLVQQKFHRFAQTREQIIHQAAASFAAKREQVCFIVLQPVPHVSLKHAWFSMMGDVCASTLTHIHQFHVDERCPCCHPGSATAPPHCFTSKKFMHDSVQHALLLLGIAAFGSRSQLFVRASQMISVHAAGAVVPACVDRWFLVMPPALVQHFRSVGMESIVTLEEARGLRRVFEVQRQLRYVIEQQQTEGEEQRNKLLTQLKQLCVLVRTMTHSKTAESKRKAVLHSVQTATSVQPTVPWGRSKLKKDANEFTGISSATRRAVAQRRNALTGADRLGVYWKM